MTLFLLLRNKKKQRENLLDDTFHEQLYFGLRLSVRAGPGLLSVHLQVFFLVLTAVIISDVFMAICWTPAPP